MFQAVQRIGGWVLWANLHMLFWLSLMPFFTGVIGEDDFNGFTMIFFAGAGEENQRSQTRRTQARNKPNQDPTV